MPGLRKAKRCRDPPPNVRRDARLSKRRMLRRQPAVREFRKTPRFPVRRDMGRSFNYRMNYRINIANHGAGDSSRLMLLASVQTNRCSEGARGLPANGEIRPRLTKTQTRNALRSTACENPNSQPVTRNFRSRPTGSWKPGSRHCPWCPASCPGETPWRRSGSAETRACEVSISG